MEQLAQNFGRWLESKPHRFTIANVAMLTLLLGMMGSKMLFMLIGGIALILGGAHCVGHALWLTVKNRKNIHLFQFALIWAPGGIALFLGAVGIYLATQHEAGSLFYFIGCVLFGFEVAMLAILGAELRGKEHSLMQYLEVK